MDDKKKSAVLIWIKLHCSSSWLQTKPAMQLLTRDSDAAQRFMYLYFCKCKLHIFEVKMGPYTYSNEEVVYLFLSASCGVVHSCLVS